MMALVAVEVPLNHVVQELEFVIVAFAAVELFSNTKIPRVALLIVALPAEAEFWKLVTPLLTVITALPAVEVSLKLTPPDPRPPFVMELLPAVAELAKEMRPLGSAIRL